MSRLSPSTKANDMLMLPQQRSRSSPFSSTWVIRPRMLLRIFLYSRQMCLASLTISFCATSQAFPKPTTKGVGKVPDRNPRSCPPPLMSGASLTLGFLLRKSAPTPLGPQILWPLMLMRSMFILLTSMSILPVACAASVCKNILCSLQSLPISSIFCLTPISLWTKMTLTQSTFSFDSRIVFLRSSTSRMPFFWTGRQVTLKPSSSRCRQVSRMHLCSICVVMICFRSFPQNLASPFRTILLDSVAPEVNTISLGSAFIRFATCSRAFSIAVEESQPNLWVLECGLPQKSVRQGIIASRTRQSMGVVAWQSKYWTFPVEKGIGVRLRREDARSIRPEKCFIPINQFNNANFHIILVRLENLMQRNNSTIQYIQPKGRYIPVGNKVWLFVLALWWLILFIVSYEPNYQNVAPSSQGRAFIAARKVGAMNSATKQQKYIFKYQTQDLSDPMMQSIAQDAAERALQLFVKERAKATKKQ